MEHFTVTRLLSATLSGPSVLDTVDVFRLSLLFRSVAPVLRRLLSFLFGCMQALSLPAPALVSLLDAPPDDMEKTTSTFPVDAFGLRLVVLTIGFIAGAVWLFVTRTPVRFDDPNSTPVADWIVNSITHSVHIPSDTLMLSPMPSEIDLGNISLGSVDDARTNVDNVPSRLEASCSNISGHPSQNTRLLSRPALSQLPGDYSRNASLEPEACMDRSSSSGLAAYLPPLSPSSTSSSPSHIPSDAPMLPPMPSEIDLANVSLGSVDDSPINMDNIVSGLEASHNHTSPHPRQKPRRLSSPAVSQLLEEHSAYASPELEACMDRSSSSGLAPYLPPLSQPSTSFLPSAWRQSYGTHCTFSKVLAHSHVSDDVSVKAVDGIGYVASIGERDEPDVFEYAPTGNDMASSRQPNGLTQTALEIFALDLLPESTSCRLPEIPSLDFANLSVGDCEDPLVSSRAIGSRIATPSPSISQGRRSCPQDVRGAGYSIGLSFSEQCPAAALKISTASHLRIRMPPVHGLPHNPQDVRGSGRRQTLDRPSARAARRPPTRSSGTAPPAVRSKYTRSDYERERQEANARCNALRRRGAELNERIEKTTKRIAEVSARWREAEERWAMYKLAEASNEEPPPPKPPPEPPSTWDLGLDEMPEPPVELPPIPTPNCSMTEDEDDD
ncbi:hypothetical protein OE88DRAFT_1667810 [Heliocybe sulcata]|uniref:Uncharacterized protein n=1 Tax=Heliocybe sulcata TaxID=5364 RepID=A0A5C3MNW1_9AGAM|nr:hypothetical protein OE88DRAFT_1667810 [Heliocybe sulcata]